MTLTLWLRRHPQRFSFVLALGISWGGIVVILTARGCDLSLMPALEAGLSFLAMLLGRERDHRQGNAHHQGAGALRQTST